MALRKAASFVLISLALAAMSAAPLLNAGASSLVDSGQSRVIHADEVTPTPTLPGGGGGSTNSGGSGGGNGGG